jgi:hypothetical protein
MSTNQKTPRDDHENRGANSGTGDRPTHLEREQRSTTVETEKNSGRATSIQKRNQRNNRPRPLL